MPRSLIIFNREIRFEERISNISTPITTGVYQKNATLGISHIASSPGEQSLYE
jgi:hypothetical protein